MSNFIFTLKVEVINAFQCFCWIFVRRFLGDIPNGMSLCCCSNGSLSWFSCWLVRALCWWISWILRWMMVSRWAITMQTFILNARFRLFWHGASIGNGNRAESKQQTPQLHLWYQLRFHKKWQKKKVDYSENEFLSIYSKAQL